jgi:hypothetical protein
MSGLEFGGGLHPAAYLLPFAQPTSRPQASLRFTLFFKRDFVFVLEKIRYDWQCDFQFKVERKVWIFKYLFGYRPFFRKLASYYNSKMSGSSYLSRI